MGKWVPYGPALCEHIILSAGLKAIANKPLRDVNVTDDQL